MRERLDQLPSGAPVFPRARATDAASSHEAAAAIERSGQANTELLAVKAALLRWPGSTSKELAEVSGIDRAAVARRLPELEQIGQIRDSGKTGEGTRKTDERPCAVTGKRSIRWWPL